MAGSHDHDLGRLVLASSRLADAQGERIMSDTIGGMQAVPHESYPTWHDAFEDDDFVMPVTFEAYGAQCSRCRRCMACGVDLTYGYVEEQRRQCAATMQRCAQLHYEDHRLAGDLP